MHLIPVSGTCAAMGAASSFVYSKYKMVNSYLHHAHFHVEELNKPHPHENLWAESFLETKVKSRLLSGKWMNHEHLVLRFLQVEIQNYLKRSTRSSIALHTVTLPNSENHLFCFEYLKEELELVQIKVSSITRWQSIHKIHPFLLEVSSMGALGLYNL